MRNFMRSLVMFLILGAIMLCRASAQNGTGAIAGTIQDSAGSILVSAKVALEPSGRQTASDNQGFYRISNLPAGEYTLTASYVGFAVSTTKVTVTAGQTVTSNVALQVASQADSVMVTAGRLQGDAEAINIERMSANIVQVLPEGTITSLPNTNIADAVGRLPSVSLERDEGEGKYIQVRGLEPRFTGVTINGVNVPTPEVTVRQIKLDVVPSNIVERLEIYKTLSADQDADGIGGTVNIVTKTPLEKPTYELSGTAGYNPLQNGFWRGGFDGTFGQRFGASKRFGVLIGGTFDKTNRGIDDLEPNPTYGQVVDPHTGNSSGPNVAYFSTEDRRSYDYYRTRYGFDIGADYKVTPHVTVSIKGLYADFHDFGDTRVYTPTAGTLIGASGTDLTFAGPTPTQQCDAAAIANGCSYGNWSYRHYVRRPDQQIFSGLVGARHDYAKDVITYDFAVSRGHNIGGQDFPTTYFSGPSSVAFTQNLTNHYRPPFVATDGTNGYDPTLYTVNESDFSYYHATQLNIQGSASWAHDYTIHSHPSTFSMGLKIRNSHSDQAESDHHYAYTGTNPFTLASVVGGYTNPTYYNKSFAIGGQAYGPTSDYNKIIQAVTGDLGAYTRDTIGDLTTSAQAFFNADERVSAGYVEDVIFLGKLRLQGGVRFENTNTHFLANTVIPNADPTQPPAISANRKDSSYFFALPSVQAQYQLQSNTNLRMVYGRGLARPNIGDEVPTTTTDPNTSPGSITQGNPNLKATNGNNIDVLVEHFFQPLGILQAGYFYKWLNDPIYNTTTTVTEQYNGQPKQFQLQQSINGPSAHIQGVEASWEQRFSFLPGMLNGFGIAANYSHTTSQATFPAGFNGGRTDKPDLQRTAPNNYNFNLTYDKSRFSSRFAISHNDTSIFAYGWNAGTGPANDPILGLKGPTGDNYLYAHTQYDVQGSYRLYKGVTFVASGLNLSNEVFGFYYGSKIYPNQREYYRPTYSFGVRWSPSHE